MRPSGSRHRPRSVVRGVLIGLAAVVVAGAGTAGTLFGLGLVQLPRARTALVTPPGMIAVPICARPIPAYTQVEREHLKDPETGNWYVQFRKPDEVPAGVLTNIAQVRGRVTARDKAAHFFFVEEDFLPKGTRPGIVAGIPSGMRALTLDATKLSGVYSVRAGDHLDMLASVPVERLRSMGDARSGWRAETALLATGRSRSIEKQTETRMLAKDAVVVTPVTTHQRPMATSSLTEGTITRNIPFQEIVIAVALEDVAPVTEALGMELEITCIARSGRPDAQPAAEPPEGKTAVPVAVRPIPAYSEVMRDDLFDVRTRELRFLYLTPEEVRQRRIVTNVGEILGRVIAREMLDGQFFTEGVLLPDGTLAGVAAGIPAGKRAFVVRADKLVGSRTLAQGDHFDLLASIPVDLTRGSPLGGSLLLPPGSSGAVAARLQKQAEVRLVVDDGVVVSPISAPKLNLVSSLAGSKKVAEAIEESIQELVIAVTPEEVARLTEALSLGLEMTVVARSGGLAAHNDAAPEAPPPSEDRVRGLDPLRDVTSIESVIGGKRETLYFVGRGRDALDRSPDNSED